MPSYRFGPPAGRVQPRLSGRGERGADLGQVPDRAVEVGRRVTALEPGQQGVTAIVEYLIADRVVRGEPVERRVVVANRLVDVRPLPRPQEADRECTGKVDLAVGPAVMSGRIGIDG